MKNKQLDTFEYNRQDDEIDLFELFSSLMQQWRWLVGITVLGMLISVAVALIIPKQYEVATQVAVPDLLDAKLLTNRGYVKYSSGELFQEYFDLLSSSKVFKEFVVKGGWVDEFFPEGRGDRTLNFLQSKIKEDLTIDVVVPKQAKKGAALPLKVVELKMMGIDEELLVRFLNEFVEYAGAVLLDGISQDGRGLVRAERVKINNEMKLLISDENKKIESRLERLKEALLLAKKVGIKRPDSVRLYSQSGDQGLAGLTAKSSLFLMGSDYLSGEIKTLKDRVKHDLFIKELLPLKKRLEGLELMGFDFVGVLPYKVNLVAEVDGKAEKPKRALIVAVGSVLAFFMAIFIALIMGAVKRRRELA